jgi:membrane-bound lytic murein transglycosylase B
MLISTSKARITFIRIFLIIISLISIESSYASSPSFEIWLKDFKILAEKKGISKTTIDNTLKDVIYLDKVIVYDNRQPEFFEKTKVYISKRASRRSVNEAKIQYLKNKEIFKEVEKKFKVEKEILLALWSTETNFGKNLGKMDIVSSLATLSFDKRRSEFFTEQLLILLELVDKNILSKEMLYGSWAGALGNFQFMPSSISKYGIDYDNDGMIDLKKSKYDSIASAANYINKMGWVYKGGCFNQVDFTKNINKELFNHSARNIKNKKKINKWIEMGIVRENGGKFSELDEIAALVLPDGDSTSPKYLVFQNYEKILKWNRSLRFGLSVCTLAKAIKDEI